MVLLVHTFITKEHIKGQASRGCRSGREIRESATNGQQDRDIRATHRNANVCIPVALSDKNGVVCVGVGVGAEA